jgi:hypothetical protein
MTFESSGLGVRWNPEGLVYRVSGSSGVRIDLRNGQTVLVGSQRAFELAQSIAERVAAHDDRLGLLDRPDS